MMNKQVTSICNVCKANSSAIEGQSKNYCAVYTLEPSFVCAECSEHFNEGYKVTDKKWESYECRNSSKWSMNNPYEYVDCEKESRLDTQDENDKPKQSYERPHKCNECSASYKHKKHLTAHMKTHNDMNPLRCEVCNKSFGSKFHLERHRAKHTDSKPHECNICNRTYKEERVLASHILKHHKKNPYICNLCNISFESKGKFSNHMAMHSDERRLKCSFCPSTFKRKQHLTRHMKTPHKHDSVQ